MKQTNRFERYIEPVALWLGAAYVLVTGFFIIMAAIQ